jgi:hypothetical protein
MTRLRVSFDFSMPMLHPSIRNAEAASSAIWRSRYLRPSTPHYRLSSSPFPSTQEQSLTSRPMLPPHKSRLSSVTIKRTYTCGNSITTLMLPSSNNWLMVSTRCTSAPSKIDTQGLQPSRPAISSIIYSTCTATSPLWTLPPMTYS